MNEDRLKLENMKLKQQIIDMEKESKEKEEYFKRVIFDLREELLDLQKELNSKREREKNILIIKNKLEKDLAEVKEQRRNLDKSLNTVKADFKLILADNKQLTQKNKDLSEALNKKVSYLMKVQKETEEVIFALKSQNEKLINELKSIYDRDSNIISNYNNNMQSKYIIDNSKKICKAIISKL